MNTISSNMAASGLFNKKDVNPIKPLYTEKLTKDEAKELRQQIVDNANAYTFNSTSVQVGVAGKQDDFLSAYEEFQSFLDDIGYEGGPIAELSQEEAAELVSEDGFFGVTKTAQRIADFVINGAGGDENLLRAGREGMLEGFKQAEEIWGGELPEISQETMKLATELVDKAMTDLGFSIIDQSV